VEAVIYSDTHVLLWLLAARHLLSETARGVLGATQTVLISPMVELELTYLHEIGRVREDASTVLNRLRSGLDLRVCERPFGDVVVAAKALTWTRDPFDRLITAQAQIGDAVLVTSDATIRQNYARAVW